jgi:hypothetical protein
MSFGALLQKRRQVRHGESILCLRVVIVTAAILLPVLLTGCGKKGQADEKKTVQKSEDDFLDRDAKLDERKYLLAGNRSLSPSPTENARMLTRYSPATPGRGCPSISLSLLNRTLILSKTNRMHSTT